MLRHGGLTISSRATHLQAVNFFSFDMYRKTFTRVGGGVLSNEARLTAGALAGSVSSTATSAAVACDVDIHLCLSMRTAEEPQDGLHLPDMGRSGAGREGKFSSCVATSIDMQPCQHNAALLAAGWRNCQLGEVQSMAQASQPASSASPWMCCGRVFCAPLTVKSGAIP